MTCDGRVGHSSLGSLPSGWKVARLKDITTRVGSGATPRGGESVYLPKRLRFALVRSQNVFDRHFDSHGLAFISDEHARELEHATLERSDILLNITGDGITFGRACLVPESVLPACVNQHVSIVRVDETMADPGYIVSYLTHPAIKGYIESFNAGGSRRAITKGHIESFEVPLPPLSEQRATAHILGTLDDKIELNRRMNETLEAMARAIFKSWFVDFDPVRAKAEGRQPTGMDAETAALFPDSFQDSPLGKIPKAWRVAPIVEDFRLTMGQSPPGETYNEDGNGLAFFQGKTDFGFRYPSKRIYCTAPTRLADGGDTLVSVRAPVGAINMANEKCCIGRGVASIRHKSGSRSYTFYAMRAQKEAFEQFEAKGTIFGSIGRKDFEDILCASPPVGLIKEFEETAFPFDQAVENNERESHTLAAIRDALLPKLISGEVRVKDAEAFAGPLL